MKLNTFPWLIVQVYMVTIIIPYTNKTSYQQRSVCVLLSFSPGVRLYSESSASLGVMSPFHLCMTSLVLKKRKEGQAN